MKFAAIAMMAVAVFTNGVEANRGASCKYAVDETDGAVQGGFSLYQKTDSEGMSSPIYLKGKATNLERGDYTLQAFDDTMCGGTATGNTMSLRERRRRKATVLKGKIGDGSIALDDFDGQSLQLNNAAGDSVACCDVTDFYDLESLQGLLGGTKDGKKGGKRGGRKGGKGRHLDNFADQN